MKDAPFAILAPVRATLKVDDDELEALIDAIYGTPSTSVRGVEITLQGEIFGLTVIVDKMEGFK